VSLKKIIFIVGPTAVGKSEVAFALAQSIQGEIISCDSMQVYKEINIASNKPSKAELKEIPHHLMNIVSVEEEFDVAQFNQRTLKAIDQIFENHHVPIVVGGSGLYMSILLDGLFQGAKANPQLRKQLQTQADEHGLESLYQQLQELDPKAAEKIHPHNLKRMIRALEVCLSEGEIFSERQKKRQGLWGQYDITLIALNAGSVTTRAPPGFRRSNV